MSERSQNGYPVLPPRVGGSLPTLRRWEVPGVDLTLTVRDGSVGFLLVHWALWFHEAIEPLDRPPADDWGYSRRRIRGGSEWSNHASATAVDLNAVLHPFGQRGTFRAASVVKMRRRLWQADYYASCIGWGGDWRSVGDEMHFEIQRPLSACEEVAANLMATWRGRRVLAANPGARAAILS